LRGKYRRIALRLFHAIDAQDFDGIVAKRVGRTLSRRQAAGVGEDHRAYSRHAAVEWQGSR
jgi:hypothetical protein